MQTAKRRTSRCFVQGWNPIGGPDSPASWLANLVTRRERLATARLCKLGKKQGRTNGAEMERLPKATCFWHVTPAINRASILNLGLLPEFSKSNTVWLVTTAKVHWAEHHTRRRHGTNDTWLIRIGNPKGLRVTRRWRGVYFTTQAIKILRL